MHGVGMCGLRGYIGYIHIRPFLPTIYPRRKSMGAMKSYICSNVLSIVNQQLARVEIENSVIISRGIVYGHTPGSAISISTTRIGVVYYDLDTAFAYTRAVIERGLGGVERVALIRAHPPDAARKGLLAALA